jgi:hypothetical protein
VKAPSLERVVEVVRIAIAPELVPDGDTRFADVPLFAEELEWVAVALEAEFGARIEPDDIAASTVRGVHAAVAAALAVRPHPQPFGPSRPP